MERENVGKQTKIHSLNPWSAEQNSLQSSWKMFFFCECWAYVWNCVSNHLTNHCQQHLHMWKNKKKHKLCSAGVKKKCLRHFVTPVTTFKSRVTPSSRNIFWFFRHFASPSGILVCRTFLSLSLSAILWRMSRTDGRTCTRCNKKKDCLNEEEWM